MKLRTTYEYKSRVKIAAVFLLKFVVVLIREFHVGVPERCFLVRDRQLRSERFDRPVKPETR